MLRSAAKGVCNAMLRAPAAAGQRRAVGDLPYKPNKYIEEWYVAGERLCQPCHLPLHLILHTNSLPGLPGEKQ